MSESLDDDDSCSISSYGGSMDESISSVISRKLVKDTLSNTEAAVTCVSKCSVMAALLVAAVVTGGLTYYIYSSQEIEEFEFQFRDVGGDIGRNFRLEALDLFVSVAGLSTQITSIAIAKRAMWPYVTLSHFENPGSHANGLGATLGTSLCPIVDENNRNQWEAYSVKQQKWIENSLREQRRNSDSLEEKQTEEDDAQSISSTIYRYQMDENGYNNTKTIATEVYDNSEGPYLPVWQLSPAPQNRSIINYNLLSHPVFSRAYHNMQRTGEPIISEVTPLDFFYRTYVDDKHNASHPHSFIIHPVYDRFEDVNEDLYPGFFPKRNVVAVIISIVPWDDFFENVLHDEEDVHVVLEDTCNNTFTYKIYGKNATFLGMGDLHDPTYDDYVVYEDFLPDSHNVSNISPGNFDDDDNHYKACRFSLRIYPTSDLEGQYKTRQPMLMTSITVLIFIFATFVFLVYDYLVQIRRVKVDKFARQASAVVSSLFPSNIADRIMDDVRGQVEEDQKRSGYTFSGTKNQLKSFLDDAAAAGNKPTGDGILTSKPIADLFPECTVMFADIVGFTAWSSVREPSQVFVYLENIYYAFDEIAKHRRVFKVETVGDCYVAVVGLPDPRLNHAMVMARFAAAILRKMNELSQKLEVTLGPDTGDLTLRIGLHSGPVTAGVLRGERSRFQLFGDTVNTAARMESNGDRNRIHISQETCTLLKAAGKSSWLVARDKKIVAKGKGELQTYWCDPFANNNLAEHSQTEDSSDSDDRHGIINPGTKSLLDNAKTPIQPALRMPEPESEVEDTAGATAKATPAPVKAQVFTPKIERLVGWNVDVLMRLLKQIAARRNAERVMKKHSYAINLSTHSSIEPCIEYVEGANVLDEVKEVIELPKFNPSVAKKQVDAHKIELDPKIRAQLHDYVTVIATLYRDNPFHNYEHASHVTMSVIKLLSRIVAPDALAGESSGNIASVNRMLHDHTYGITSDPLTQFSVVLSALVHDVDHPGVPNAQLVKEKVHIATVYRNKSIAEQNSVDMAWELLMDDSFEDLRDAIYTNQKELERFRSLIVNTVMATDICDKELKELRNARWDKAFAEQFNDEGSLQEDILDLNRNRKATIVIEHLIQASDVAHTMQHWHIYRKWNERFFQENMHAYKAGRAESNPKDFWYKGEIGFFDFYIIPLAKKLKECGVFGVSCDEYLNYAMANRKEWEQKGEEIVAEMYQKYKDMEFSYDAEQCKLGG